MHELDFVKKDISNIPEIKNNKHRVWGKDKFKDFLLQTTSATKFVFQEKEIFLFLLVQWIVIGLVYYLWIQMLGWIPKSIWANDNDLTNTILNLVFLGWSFLLVGVASYPIGIVSGCIGAAYFLRKEGYPSTIANTLKIVLPKSLELWTFLWIDGWITVNQILLRLPKKGGSGDNALSELLYFSWKLGTIGILPAILNGRNLIDAGKESVSLVIKHPQETLLLRGGYSLVCWIIGVVSYIGALLFFIQFHSLLGAENDVYQFYFWMGIPIFFSVGIVVFFLRPIFIIASCRLYTEYFQEQNMNLSLPTQTSKITRALAIFVTLLLIIAAVFFFREQLGIMKILRLEQ